MTTAPASARVTMHVRPPGADPAGWRQALRPNRRSVVVAALATLAVAIGLLLALPTPRADTVIPVDPSAAISEARATPGFTVHLPQPLPAGWQPNSARFQLTKDGPQLHVGYLAPDGGYVGLEQADMRNVRRYVTVRSAGNVFADLRTINGQVWVHLTNDRKAQDTLAWFGPHGVVMVTGTASVANLERLAASLQLNPSG